MSAKIVIIFLLVVCADFSASKIPKARSMSPSTNTDFMKFMIDSQSLQLENPQRSLECFDRYIPTLNRVTADFEDNYLKCVSASEKAHQSIESKALSDLAVLKNLAVSSCKNIAQCESQSKLLKSFECFKNIGIANIKVFNNISTSTQDQLALYKESYHWAKFEEDACITTSDRQYVEETACFYDLLQKCFMGETTSTTKCRTKDTSTTESATTTVSMETPHTQPQSSESTDVPTTTDSETTTQTNEHTTTSKPESTETSATETVPTGETETTVTERSTTEFSAAPTTEENSTDAETTTDSSTTKKVTKRTTTPKTTRSTTRKTTRSRTTKKSTTKAPKTTTKKDYWEEIRKRWEEWLGSHESSEIDFDNY